MALTLRCSTHTHTHTSSTRGHFRRQLQLHISFCVTTLMSDFHSFLSISVGLTELEHFISVASSHGNPNKSLQLLLSLPRFSPSSSGFLAADHLSYFLHSRVLCNGLSLLRASVCLLSFPPFHLSQDLLLIHFLLKLPQLLWVRWCQIIGHSVSCLLF